MPCRELLLLLSNGSRWFRIQAIFLTTRKYLQKLCMHYIRSTVLCVYVCECCHIRITQSCFIISFFHCDWKEVIYGEKYLLTEMNHDTQINKHLVIMFSFCLSANNERKMEIGKIVHWIVWITLTLQNRCDIEQFCPTLSSATSKKSSFPTRTFFYFFKKWKKKQPRIKKRTIFSSCYELNIKFYFSTIYFFQRQRTISNFSAHTLGNLCANFAVVQIEWKKKPFCFEKFKKVFFAFSHKAGLKNLNHFAYNFPAATMFVCVCMQVKCVHRSMEALKSLVADFMYKTIKYNLTQWNYEYTMEDSMSNTSIIISRNGW